MYRRGPWNFTIAPRGKAGWTQFGAWTVVFLVPTVVFAIYAESLKGRPEFWVAVALYLVWTLVWSRASIRWMKARAEESGANIGRCRVIELQPNEYADCIWNLHQDDNNRLNPEGTGWIVRGFFNLTDNPDSYMILREDKDDPSTETRIPLPAGTQVIIDTQRLWHAVWHRGSEPRYCLITSWESGPDLGEYIQARHPRSRVESAALDPAIIAAAQDSVTRRRAERVRHRVIAHA
jgi:hypothetical protein